MDTRTPAEKAADQLHARMSWGQAEAVAFDLDSAGLLNDGRGDKYRFELEELVADLAAARAIPGIPQATYDAFGVVSYRLKTLMKDIG